MLVLQINKGDADYFLEQILVDPITTIYGTKLAGMGFPHSTWNRTYSCGGTGPTRVLELDMGIQN
jgi:hypothetical protein